MKRFSTLLKRSKSSDVTATNRSFDHAADDSPEASGPRAIRLFCESGSASNGGEEVLQLPVIVEAAESSPTAAAAAAHQIRLFLTKEWGQKPHVQYNAIMLIRILSDHPGPTFTRNFDKQFVGTVKECLRNCKDASVQQILRETLDNFEVNKQYDESLQLLLQMWRKEKGGQASLSRGGYPPNMQYGMPPQQQQYEQVYGNGQSRPQPSRRASRRELPAPAELAGRVEEAKNTAKILMQLLQSTPPEGVMDNELIKEFSERCQGAQKSMQNYINCDNPPPDHDTLQTLIETNEQLSLAGSRYQRAILAARRAMGASPSPGVPNGATALALPPITLQQADTQTYSNGYFQQPSPQRQPPPQMSDGIEPYIPPPGPPPKVLNSPQNRDTPPTHLQPAFAPSSHHQQQQQESDPFADPTEYSSNPPPPAIEPTNYTSTSTPHRKPINNPTFNLPPSESQSPSTPRTHNRRQTLDLENAYSPSPVSLDHRPGPGPWHNSTISPSYIGRQASAVGGLTMHGAEPSAEIDGESGSGRSEVGEEMVGAGQEEPQGVEPKSMVGEAARKEQKNRRVDVAGTGGFRSSWHVKR